MKSKDLSESSKLLRNEYPLTKSGFPLLRPENIPPIGEMLSFRDTRNSDPRAEKTEYLVHFFKDDDRLDSFYDRPYGDWAESWFKKFAQYSAICTPDFSLYPQMPRPVQQMQIFKNRWCGAYWQDLGLCVVPTFTWGDQESYSFCFDGIPQDATVAISTVGCRAVKQDFLAGYYAMHESLHPRLIYCYGTPFEEIAADVVSFPYEAFKKGGVTNGRSR